MAAGEEHRLTLQSELLGNDAEEQVLERMGLIGRLAVFRARSAGDDSTTTARGYQPSVAIEIAREGIRTGG